MYNKNIYIVAALFLMAFTFPLNKKIKVAGLKENKVELADHITGPVKK